MDMTSRKLRAEPFFLPLFLTVLSSLRHLNPSGVEAATKGRLDSSLCIEWSCRAEGIGLLTEQVGTMYSSW
eukprot:m.226669 g.226669  ORF g.226669 m.226669 type:complete len:71 (+) comp54225_c1_seq3:38-250(+)